MAITEKKLWPTLRADGFGEMVQLRLALGSFFLHSKNQEEMILKAQKVRRLIKEHIDSILNQYDVVIYPCAADYAPYIDDSKNRISWVYGLHFNWCQSFW
nr:amidase family protein [Mycoplasmopsis bovis]